MTDIGKLNSMSSAPRDKTTVILFWQGTPDTAVGCCSGQWEEAWKGWNLDLHDGHGCGCCHALAKDSEFVGWMPTP